jgi:hypothetical protein
MRSRSDANLSDRRLSLGGVHDRYRHRVPTLRWKLFGTGKLPSEYDEVAADPKTLFCAQGVPITSRVDHLRAPNRYASKAIAKHSGAVVLTRDRLVLSIGKRMRSHATFSNDPAAPLALEFRADGIAVELDAALAFPETGKGSLRLDLRVPIPEPALAQLLTLESRATAPEADLLTMTRWA